MPLKVMVLTNLFPSAWDPNRAAYNRQQFRRLGERMRVSIVTAVEWLGWLRGRKGDPALGGIDARHFVFFYLPGMLRSWQPRFLLASLLPRHGLWMRRARFDCLIASWAFPDGVAVRHLAERLGLPYVVKVHGNDINVMSRDPARVDAIRDCLVGAHAVVAVSRALADAVVALGVPRARVHVIYNGVDTQRFTPGSREEARQRLGVATTGRRILYVGNIKASKGCLDLVDGVAPILREHRDATLAFVGDGPDRDALVRRIEALGIGRQVLLLGEAVHASLPDHYRAADLVCLPSHNEGVPNVLLEAMACGVPVLATRVGGIPEVVPECAGMLVPPQRQSALTAAFSAALGRSWDNAAIRAHAEAFRWDDNVDALERVLDVVVAEARRAGVRTR